MDEKPKKKGGLKRRAFLPILGSGLLLPLLPVHASSPGSEKEEASYMTLLKPDGTIVKVKKSTVDKARIVQPKLSNAELRNWLENTADDPQG
jgi:hypothetical protein